MNFDHYASLVQRCARSHRQAQYRMDTVLLRGIEIDEVSMLFATVVDLNAFMHHSESDRMMEHFDSVDCDTMSRIDGGESFDVRFEFLRLRGATWRMELMCVLGGLAPLHSRALALQSPALVHASYKTPDLEAYEKETKNLFDDADHYEMEAEYVNSYGMFSYWTVPAIGSVYLKPRVNLRDSTTFKK